MSRGVRLALVASVAIAGFGLGATASAHSTDACDGPCRFDVRKLGTGQGTVTGATGRIDCGLRCTAETDYEEPVFLIATPAPGSVFTGWVGDCLLPISGNRCDIKMNNGPITFYAVFDRIGDPPTPLTEPSSGSFPVPPSWEPPPGAPNPRGCTLMGSAGDDDLDGTPGRDVVCGLGGNDHLHGGGGNDVLYGDGGNDVLEAHGGNDALRGGLGHDRLIASAGSDVLVGGAGRDTMLGGPGRDTLRARDGARDVLNGGTGTDIGRTDGLDRVRALERRVA
jgi:hypothetical protein